jgi:hypothetical protein
MPVNEHVVPCGVTEGSHVAFFNSLTYTRSVDSPDADGYVSAVRTFDRGSFY